MKVFLSFDMEGIAGIVDWQQCIGDGPAYQLGQQLTLGEVRTASGHTFQVRQQRAAGPRKDTVTVVPLQTVVADLIADNPGRWLAHCHNLYHSMSGMMALLDYGA